jgi:5'-deoxy-5'-methylthioadenosine phosphorylase
MLAIIGGTGLSSLDILGATESEIIATPYSDDGVEVERLSSHKKNVIFLPRHGKNHVLPPHQINYRANIRALREVGVSHVIAINAVGGINAVLEPGALSVPDQIIDYTYSRKHTFFESDLEEVTHIDFTHPFDSQLRALILRSINSVNTSQETPRVVMDGGVYGCTQGPRLETAAEIGRLKRDGCDMVGMTGMPEAALARELGIAYAGISLSVNWAAGLSDDPITLPEIHQVLNTGMSFINALLDQLIRDYS